MEMLARITWSKLLFTRPDHTEMLSGNKAIVHLQVNPGAVQYSEKVERFSS